MQYSFICQCYIFMCYLPLFGLETALLWTNFMSSEYRELSTVKYPIMFLLLNRQFMGFFKE